MAIAHYAYTALDCDNPIELADFYSKITGWPVEPLGDFPPEDVTWLELLDDNGFTKMAFQLIDNYQKPTWPTGGLPQQAHMDFHAKDLDIAEKQLLEIGAVKAEYQPKPHRFRIYLDLAGHPFCMVQNAHD
jgi:Glyoxalase-like domain